MDAKPITSSRFIAFLLVTVWVPSNAWALDGANSVSLTPHNGWQAFELVTQGDALGTLSDAGYGSNLTRGKFDGLGTHVDGERISVFVNHETSDAAISRIDLDIAAVRQAVIHKLDADSMPFPAQIATGVGYAYDRIYDGAYHATSDPLPVAEGYPAIVTYSNSNFDRFCSGSSYLPNAFGTGSGFEDAMYITGEEVSGGKFYVLDSSTRTLWEAPDLGLGSWENAAPVDTLNTEHVALLLSSDANAPGSDYLRLYIGTKGADANADGTIDFLEHNGLRGGSVYYFVPESGASTTDLPNGTVVGTWSSSTAGALREDKLEDVHTNPANGNQLVLADQTDGVYRLDIIPQFVDGQFDPAATFTTITQIDAHPTAPLGSPDNLTWSASGRIFVQEDGDGFEIWQIDEGGGGHFRLAQALSEPSGIIDVSSELGFRPASVLLSSLMGSSSGAQLVALIAPDAALALPGDYNEDGSVDAADYTVWRDNLGSPTALPNDDTAGVEVDDYTRWKSNVGQTFTSAGAAAHRLIAVPEPSTQILLAAMIYLPATCVRCLWHAAV